MPEEKQQQGWRKRFLANRMAFESILFEKEIAAPEPKKKPYGILVLLAIFLFHALLLTQAVVRAGNNFRQEDSKGLETVRMYGAAVASEGWSALFLPKLSGTAEIKPPLYYLSFLPALKLFPANPALALACVNSCCLLLIMLSFYYAVRKSRNAQSAWLAASLAAAFPFIIGLGRRVSPDLALVAFVSATYCCYINADEFKSRKWSFLLGVCFSLGLVTDTRFFIYVLPLVPFALNGFLNPLTGRNMRPFILLTLLIPVPWYFRNVVFSLVRDIFVANSLASAAGFGAFNPLNLVRDLALLLDGLHLVFLPLAAAALIWFFLSLFMAYEEKELVLAWFLVPFCVFSLFSRADANIFPALMPFALAAGIMTPAKARNYFLGLTLLFPLLYQAGLAPYAGVRLGGREVGVFGRERAKSEGLKNADAIRSVCARTGNRPAIVQLVGRDDYFNPDSMRLLAGEQGCGNLNFVYYPKDWMGLADFVLYKTASFSSGHVSGEFAEHSAEITRAGGWFRTVFREENMFERSDTSKLFVYAKDLPSCAHSGQGIRMLEKLSVGSLNFEDVVVDVGAFDEASGTYESVEVFIPHFFYRGVNIYSIKLRFEGLSVMPLSEDFSDIRLTGCRTVRVRLLRLREEAVNAILKLKSTIFQNLRVQLDDSLSIMGTYRDIGLNIGFFVTPKDSGVNLKLSRIIVGMLEISAPGDMPAAETDGKEDPPPDEDAVPPGGKKTPAATPEPSPFRKAGKELAQFQQDTATAQILKDTGYDKIVEKLIDAAQENKARQGAKAAKDKPPAPPKQTFSSLLLRLFSMDYDFLDEKTVPFKLKMNSIAFRNGMMTVK